MTISVIDVGSMSTPVKTLLEKCGSRQEILSDARAIDPALDLVAVHRWHQRDSVPSKYWLAIVQGAKARRQRVTLDDFAKAHTPPSGMAAHG